MCFLASWADDEILTRLIGTWFCYAQRRAGVSLTSPIIDWEGAFTRGYPRYSMSKVIKDPTSANNISERSQSDSTQMHRTGMIRYLLFPLDPKHLVSIVEREIQ